MGWVKVNGISVLLAEGAEIADYDGMVTRATVDMIQFRETWGDDEVFAVQQRAGLYTMQRVNGEDRILMGPVPSEPVVEEDEKYVSMLGEEGFAPAFHTKDANGNFIGFTVCLSGTWGPPYMFVPCEESDLWDFWNGCWNYDYGETRPDDYSEESRFVCAEGEYEFFEVPAAHEYCCSDGWLGQDSTYTSEWTAGAEQISDCCGCSEACIKEQRQGYWDMDATAYINLLLWIDWNLPEEAQLTLDTGFMRQRLHGPTRMAGGSIYCAGGCSQQSNCCQHVWSHVPLTEENQPEWLGSSWTSLLNKAYSAYPMLEWNMSGRYWGETPWMTTDWSTFTSTNIGDGLYYCGQTIYEGHTWIDVGGRYDPRPYANINYKQDYRTVTADPGITSYDYVSVFGERTILMNHSHPGQNGYYNAEHAIRVARPRIYKISEDSKLGLACIVREDREYFEYHYFGDEVTQLGATAAKYVYINDWKHELPITVNDEPVFGNGYFSLFELESADLEISKPRGNYDDTSRDLTEI